jgi:hypothetical protein
MSIEGKLRSRDAHLLVEYFYQWDTDPEQKLYAAQNCQPEDWRIMAYRVGVGEPSSSTIRQVLAILAERAQEARQPTDPFAGLS